jgi:hypothetical protein
MNIEQLQNRLERLEQRQFWLLRTAGVAALVLAAGAVMAQVQPAPPPVRQPLPIAASSFELVDVHGRTRAVLRMEAGEPVLRFHDAAGAPALRLAVRGSDGVIEYTDGGQELSLMKPAHSAHPLTTR